jgi:urease accessory protein
MDEDFAWLPFLMQTSDALFPTGAYAHSLGFEETVRLGLVRDEATLRTFLLDQIVPAQREQELPYFRFAYIAAVDGDLDELCRIDAEISAWKLARETREASTQLGIRRLKALREINRAPLLADFENAIVSVSARGHHLTICGLQAAVEGVPLPAALLALFYQSLSAICGAAMKLIRIGQSGCQRVLREASARASTSVAESLAVQRASAGWFNPLLEIASMRHERAEERLFIS